MCYYPGAMRGGAGRTATMLMLALWFVAGPIGMAFGPCAEIGMVCQTPCGTSSSPARVPEVSAPTQVVDTTVVQAVDEILAGSLRVPDPPPKSLLPA